MERLPLTDPDLYWKSGIPHDYFRWLRDHEPVAWHDDPVNGGFWAVSRFDDVVAVSRNWQRYSNARPVASIEDPATPEEREFHQRMFPNQDPPEQTRMRRLVSPAFTPGRLRQLVPLVERTCTELVDVVLSGEQVDMVDIGEQLAMAMVATVFGLPRADWESMLDRTRRITNFQDPEVNPTQGSRFEASIAAREYAYELIRAVRADPDAHDGVLPELVRLEVHNEDGTVDRLSDDDLITFFGVTIFAGVETTAHVVGEAVLAAMEHPGLFDEVAQAGECAPAVVEEFLRWRGNVVNFRRTATEDHELRGVPIREDDRVLILFPSANRDERHFRHPDVFDPSRQPLDQVGFGGGGPHHCLGAQLARLDLRLLFGELFTRVGRFEPAGEPVRLRSNQLAGWIHVPVTATARG